MPHCFTRKFPGLANELRTDVAVAAAFDPVKNPTHQPVLNNFPGALWDTGATNSVVSQKVVDACGLQPTGMVQSYGVHGSKEVATYLIAIMLPSGVGFPAVTVTCSDIEGVDVLIGMDVISKGDFAVTNVGGKTIMSFRVPSCAVIDYVSNQGLASAPGTGVPFRAPPQPGRNDPCHCGSRKKFKHCHGAA